MAAPSTEARELQLLDNVELKILGVANQEEKLTQLLSRYLAPVLLKAGSEHPAVRAKVRAPEAVDHGIGANTCRWSKYSRDSGLLFNLQSKLPTILEAQETEDGTKY